MGCAGNYCRTAEGDDDTPPLPDLPPETSITSGPAEGSKPSIISYGEMQLRSVSIGSAGQMLPE
jgi:hypothetical protein